MQIQVDREDKQDKQKCDVNVHWSAKYLNFTANLLLDSF